jgi:hypothetical protein
MNNNNHNPTHGDNFTLWTEKLEKEVKMGLQKEIAKHKADGRNIYYSHNGVPAFETPEGRHFEYRRLADGTCQVIREITKQSENT